MFYFLAIVYAFLAIVLWADADATARLIWMFGATLVVVGIVASHLEARHKRRREHIARRLRGE